MGVHVYMGQVSDVICKLCFLVIRTRVALKRLQENVANFHDIVHNSILTLGASPRIKMMVIKRSVIT